MRFGLKIIGKMSDEINNYFGYVFDQVKGESLDLYGCVLSAPGINSRRTSQDLRKADHAYV